MTKKFKELFTEALEQGTDKIVANYKSCTPGESVNYEDDFVPHMMYDPKTGKGHKAEKEADHLRMKKMGYTHEPIDEAPKKAPKIDPKKYADFRKSKEKTKRMSSTQRALSKISAKANTLGEHTAKEIKMAIGIASDPRYKGGNMTGATKAIDKISKGLSDHPKVAAVLRRQNEATIPAGKTAMTKKPEITKKDKKTVSKIQALMQREREKRLKKEAAGNQTKRLMSPLQKLRLDKEKDDRDRDGKLK